LLGIGASSGHSDCHESVGSIFTVPPLENFPSACDGGSVKATIATLEGRLRSIKAASDAAEDADDAPLIHEEPEIIEVVAGPALAPAPVQDSDSSDMERDVASFLQDVQLSNSDGGRETCRDVAGADHPETPVGLAAEQARIPASQTSCVLSSNASCAPEPAVASGVRTNDPSHCRGDRGHGPRDSQSVLRGSGTASTVPVQQHEPVQAAPTLSLAPADWGASQSATGQSCSAGYVTMEQSFSAPGPSHLFGDIPGSSVVPGSHTGGTLPACDGSAWWPQYSYPEPCYYAGVPVVVHHYTTGISVLPFLPLASPPVATPGTLLAGNLEYPSGDPESLGNMEYHTWKGDEDAEDILFLGEDTLFSPSDSGSEASLSEGAPGVASSSRQDGPDAEEDVMEKLRKRIGFLLPLRRLDPSQPGSLDSDITGTWSMSSLLNKSVKLEKALSRRRDALTRHNLPLNTPLTQGQVHDLIWKPWQDEWIRQNKPQIFRSPGAGKQARKVFHTWLHQEYEITKVLMALLMRGDLPDEILDPLLRTCKEGSQAGTAAPGREAKRKEAAYQRQQSRLELRSKQRSPGCMECGRTPRMRRCKLCCRGLCCHCLLSHREVCLSCPEVDRVLPNSAAPPPNCQICQYRVGPVDYLERCSGCRLFGCAWCHRSDQVACRICPSAPGHRWPRKAPTGPPLRTTCDVVLNASRPRIRAMR
jgi:hypothetical protein